MSDKEEFGWDDDVEVPETGFTILPEGEAFFIIEKLERQKKAFGKFGTVNVAVMTMRCSIDEAEASIPVQFALVKSMGWKLVQLATAVGLRKHGEGSTVNKEWWGAFVGLGGRCLIGHRKYQGRDGTEKTSNDITKFIDPEGGEEPTFD
jgi:hypothetical protein